MKNSIYVFGMLAGITLASCQTSTPKEETTEASAQAAPTDAKQDVNPEYPVFRRDAEQQINDNDKKITNLRAKLDKPGNAPLDNVRKQKLDDLEKRNADLRAKLYGYEKQHSDWEAFKLDFNHDKDNLRDAFHDFGDDLKK